MGEELSKWRLKHRESVRRERGEEEESDEDESDVESDEDVGDNGDKFEETLGEIGPMVAERHTEDKNRRISWAFGEGEDPSLPSVNPRLELQFSHSEQQSPLTNPPSR